MIKNEKQTSEDFYNHIFYYLFNWNDVVIKYDWLKLIILALFKEKNLYWRNASLFFKNENN
jgi:hypothetical protein